MSEIRDIWLHANNIIRSARQIINNNLRPLGLSSAEGNVLLHLWTHDQQMRQEQLVQQLEISKPAISRTLNSLEKKGYIIRHSAPDDKRAQLVQLTAKAREIGPEIEQVYNQIYSLAVQDISEEELDYFLKLFGRISDKFSRELTKKQE